MPPGMASLAVLPALALVSGAACGALTSLPLDVLFPILPILAILAIGLWRLGWRCATATVVALGFCCAGGVLAADARDTALHTSLRALLDGRFGGFAHDMLGPGGQHDAIRLRAVLTEDAAQIGDVTSLRVRASAAQVQHAWVRVNGGVMLSVGGLLAASRVETWRAGRTIEAPVTFRRPSRYLNDGVPDFERDLALDGTTLFGSVKSGLLVDVVDRGTAIEELAGGIRATVRSRVRRWVEPHAELSSAIVTAILIGDRTGLPDEVRDRLQAAGTYHVIAISGGNIAILTAAIVCALMLCGVTGRPAAFVTIVLLLAYAQVVTAGASVWRATLMATLYLAARLLDHRSPAWHALVVTAALVVCVRPLDVRDPAFALTFGATAALLEAGRRVHQIRWPHRGLQWVTATIAASAAAETVLFPISAEVFSRTTIAGLVLNLAAVPLMAIVQIAGMAAVGADGVTPLAGAAGWVAHAAATTLVGSASLVDHARWLTARVPPPPISVVVTYYLGLGLMLLGGRPGPGPTTRLRALERASARPRRSSCEADERRREVGPYVRPYTAGTVRAAGGVLATGAALAIYFGIAPSTWWAATNHAAALRVTVFDVGQGDATLVELPENRAILVDSGGIPGGGSFDIGGRVLAPALWARGIRSLDALVLTHGDPDHIGGASSIINDFGPTEVWEGVPVLRHRPLQHVFAAAHERGARVLQQQAGEAYAIGGASIRVLHPPAPDWERQRVRNSDSIVIEVVYGDVAVLMTGDIEADVERELVPHLTPARLRVLRVAHHGSRTSSSRELLEGWRPQIAVISCGRGNRFGHPAPEVVQRLRDIGATIYRTDLDGQITIETNGRDLRTRTYVSSMTSTGRP